MPRKKNWRDQSQFLSGMGMSAGAGDFSSAVPQYIFDTDRSCEYRLVSQGRATALNGNIRVDRSGGFEGASLKLGSTEREPCAGTYHTDNRALTITCAGTEGDCTAVITESR